MGDVYFGGQILTMEDPEQRPEAVYVDKGIIRGVGDLQSVLKQAGTKANLRDLKGKCLMPGFIDTHSHVVLNGQMSLMADLSGCRNFADVEKNMAQYISDNKITPKGIAIGRGYDQNFLQELDHPGREVLDRVSTTVPILILHVSGHLACANSAMLKVAGIDRNTPDPKGGRICRMDDGAEPNGVLEESAMMSAQSLIGKRMKINFKKMLGGMTDLYMRHGVTTCQEGAGNKGNMVLLKLAQALGILKIDVVFYPLMGQEGEKMLHDAGDKVGIYKKHIKLGGYKMILDGSPQGRTAWMSQPYLGEDPEYCAYPWMTREEAYRNALTAVNENRQLLCHCNGDAASQLFLDAYENALAESTNPNRENLRPVMIHCQTVRNDQLDRMAAVKMIPSIFVGHVFYWGDVHVKNFGLQRGHHISPARDALERELVINFHQDTPITRPDMLHSVWCAVNRLSRLGDVIGEDQKLDVYEALKAVTINASYEYFEEDTKGSLKCGKRADMVILDKCPLDVDPMEIRNIRVLETIKDGKTIYSA